MNSAITQYSCSVICSPILPLSSRNINVEVINQVNVWIVDGKKSLYLLFKSSVAKNKDKKIIVNIIYDCTISLPITSSLNLYRILWRFNRRRPYPIIIVQGTVICI